MRYGSMICYKRLQSYSNGLYWVLLGFTDMPLHFGMSLCNPLKDNNLPYTRWKGTCIAFIWGRVAWSAPRGCRETSSVSLKMAQALYITPQKRTAKEAKMAEMMKFSYYLTQPAKGLVAITVFKLLACSVARQWGGWDGLAINSSASSSSLFFLLSMRTPGQGSLKSPKKQSSFSPL